MTAREATHQYRLSQWAQRLSEQKGSGLNITSWCEANGISRNTYFYWQRKLREAAAEHIEQPQAAENRLVPSGWTRLESKVDAPAEAGISIEVGGCRITATAETDPELLAKVCRMLKTL